MTDLDPTPIYTDTAWRHGFAPMPEPQPGDRDDLVRVVFTRDTRNLANYPADIRVIPL